MTTTFSVQGLTRIREYFGDDPSDFCVCLHCEVTSAETPGGEAFEVTAISPSQLKGNLEAGSEEIELGRGYLVLLDYNENLIRSRLQKLLNGSGASTWEALHRYVERFFDWV